ncbi:MAG: hypothetical protein ND807_03045 [Vicinamibacterales bacterium]|nr:hypothetical protein [Vicinamibacterales bacterium]
MDSGPAQQFLKDLRHALLRLHKTLLDWQRAGYERANGRLTSNQLLDALLTEPQFAWLRGLSQMVVRIDEILEDETPPGDGDLEAVVGHVRDLTSPNETGNPYEQRYYQALQESPDAVFAHRDLVTLLKAKR